MQQIEQMFEKGITNTFQSHLGKKNWNRSLFAKIKLGKCETVYILLQSKLLHSTES